ncbi:oxygen-independent coproporphyrinogen III oxidase [Roseisalinus antarcticus]|uniref:Coproporphyrinogen-III oxidase n=1 Tax=Roseisalinus antarcticus TaxID=254357 RepID=A0A1Y5SBK8_9RHOB|nr:oxygen-independent coproporphyrinogen III oxidase [Roseisalinus antarcticus]SLN33944.1 Oxygen-independent coproporphyrinogen-III oxidase [Roseisalinus antarcticus]
MTTLAPLRKLGLLDARVPRYTSYPPANHFSPAVDAATVAGWMSSIAPGSRISIYVHVPYCRTLCWFCACRTQGTATNKPLAPYLALLKAELKKVSETLPKDVVIGNIHLGGGTPTILPVDLLTDLCETLKDLRPWAPDAEFSVEIDPTEIHQARIDVLARYGMTRASIGIQDFDEVVQQAIGRIQPYELTRNVVDMLRAAGVRSLNVDALYGLPYQTCARLAASIQRILSLAPDRVALFGYAHVPWMAKRQVMIPADALPDAEERLDLFDTARRLLTWDGFRSIGIDHFALEGDSLSDAARTRTLRRNFQGYTDDQSDVLIGIGASAISQYPQGYAQNISTSSRYAQAVAGGELATERGHAFSDDDRLRRRMIESLMCDYALNLDALSADFDTPKSRLMSMTADLRDRFAEYLDVTDGAIRLTRNAALIARMAAHELDAYQMPEGRHSRAL